jgi:hypothetical protein
VSNVTGGKFDRIEAKFITDWILNGRSEAEIRIAAFKHSHANQSKTCVSASSTVRLTGNWVADETTGRVNVGLGKWRWMHGLPRGWNVDTDDEDAIYTIELQHRNPDDCLQVVDPSTQVLAYTKKSNEAAPAPLGVWDPIYVDNDPSGTYRMIAERRDRNASGDWPGKAIWVTTEPGWDGAYSVSNMHYCVGMSSDQLPEATETGWFWYSGGDAEFTRQPNIEEGYMGF